MLKEKILALASQIHGDVILDSRHLHQNPELSFHEYQTSAFVAAALDKLGIPHQNMAGTGIVALLTGRKPSEAVIALRADMDALPITEANNVSYISKNSGVMHACGHDVHTSSLLGTAKILSQLKDEFAGTIKFIFQPAEEKLPGGASLMIQEECWKTRNLQRLLGSTSCH